MLFASVFSIFFIIKSAPIEDLSAEMELVTDSAEDIKSNLPKKGKATRAGRKVKKEKQVDEPAPEPENDITTDTKTIVNIIDLKQETNAKNKNSNINQLPVIEKQLELEFDIGSLMASDPNEISVMSYRYETEHPPCDLTIIPE